MPPPTSMGRIAIGQLTAVGLATQREAPPSPGGGALPSSAGSTAVSPPSGRTVPPPSGGAAPSEPPPPAGVPPADVPHADRTNDAKPMRRQRVIASVTHDLLGRPCAGPQEDGCRLRQIDHRGRYHPPRARVQHEGEPA